MMRIVLLLISSCVTCDADDATEGQPGAAIGDWCCGNLITDQCVGELYTALTFLRGFIT